MIAFLPRFLLLALLLAVGTGLPQRDAFAASPKELLEGAMNKLRGNKLPPGVVRSNGRLEAEYVDVTSKLAGRLVEVNAVEGQMLRAGDVVAKLDSAEIEAQLRSAEAQIRRAERLRDQAQANVALRQSERNLAAQELQRTDALQQRGFATDQQRDQRRSQMTTADAALRAALAAVEEAKAAVDVAEAETARLRTVMKDTVLLAPRDGRVQYKLLHIGEVVAPGTKIVTMVDLSDIYMTLFLPAKDAGRLALGDEARLVLDPFPSYVVPARVSFVASEAQFTPKAVETAEEREKLVFRVKVAIPAELLKRYEEIAKTGIRGLAYLRTRPDAEWPKNLGIVLPQ